MDDPRQIQSARTGIAILNAWATQEPDENFTARLIEEVVAEGGDDAISEIISGLISIAGHLLINAAKQSNISEVEVLQHLGRQYAGPEA